MRILFITSRNVYNTSGELRLIKNRTEILAKSYGVETDILLFKRDRVLAKTQETFGYSTFEGVYYNKLNHYFKFCKFLTTVRQRIHEHTYDAVIVSGGFLLFNMVRFVKKISPQTRVIVDIHGTIEELKEFSGKSWTQNIMRRAFYKTSKCFQEKSFPMADGFFVVSSSLKEHIQSSIKGLRDKPFFIIPCGIKETKIDHCDAEKNRAFYRAKYDIANDEVLFVYSGGVSPWQCIEESVSLFKHFCEDSLCNCKMLILSGDLNYIGKFKSDRIIIDSYPGDEVRKVLCAGDYAFLLRGDFITNHVAYPNKFLEYVASGMKIIATKNVDDIAKQIIEYSVGVIVEFDDFLSTIIKKESFEYLSDIEKRNALLLSTSFETTLKPFVNYLSE